MSNHNNFKNYVQRFLARPGFWFSYIKDNLRDKIFLGKSLGKCRASIRYNAYRTESSDYYMLKRIFDLVEIKSDDVLLDVGCGYGRVIAWWLSQGLKNKIYGVELNPEVAKETAMRFAKFSNVEIISGDVLEKFPKETTLIYLYNPFDNNMTYNFVQMLNNISKSNIRVIYRYYLYLENFKNSSNWSIIYRQDKITKLLLGIVNDSFAILQKKI